MPFGLNRPLMKLLLPNKGWLQGKNLSKVTMMILASKEMVKNC